MDNNNKNIIDLNDFVNHMEYYIEEVNEADDIIYIRDRNNDQTYILLSEQNYMNCLNNINNWIAVIYIDILKNDRIKKK